MLIGVGIGVGAAELGRHGARVSERHADRQSEARGLRIDGDKPQHGLDRCDDDERRVTRRELTAREPIGREPFQPHREIAPGVRRRAHADPTIGASGRMGRSGS